jgi:hypothetical protein
MAGGGQVMGRLLLQCCVSDAVVAWPTEALLLGLFANATMVVLLATIVRRPISCTMEVWLVALTFSLYSTPWLKRVKTFPSLG